MKQPSSQSTAITVTAEVLPPEESRATGHGARAEIAACNALHALVSGRAAEARRLAEATCHYAILLGCKLQTLKAATPHGGWEVLFEGHEARVTGQKALPDGQMSNVGHFTFGKSTASNYIRAAEGALRCPGLAVHQRKRILALAARPEIPDELPEAEAQALDRATRGQTLRQLYIDLGVIRASPTEKTGMGGNKRTEFHRPLVMADEVWSGILAALNSLDQTIRLGHLTLLGGQRLDEMEAVLRSLIDDLKKVSRK